MLRLFRRHRALLRRLAVIVWSVTLHWSCGDTPKGPTTPSPARTPGSLTIRELAPPSTEGAFIGRFDAPTAEPGGGGSHTVPGPPTNLVAQVTGNVVVLIWATASGDPTTYVIEAGSSSGLSNLANFATGSTATSFSGTAPDGTYYVRVLARNAAGTSPPSNEVIVTVGRGPCAPPGPPSGLTFSVTGNSVSLSWNAPATGSPPSSYIIEAGSTSGAANLFNGNVGNVTSLNAQAGDGAYFVRVRAVNACGTSGPSNEVNFRVGPSPGPISMITPYVSASDIASIREAFSLSSNAPWGFPHNGIDFFPIATLKPFRAVCPGVVEEVRLWANDVTSNWQVNVRIKYNSAFSVEYGFEPFSRNQAEGNTQRSNITVSTGQTVSQGQVIGLLHTVSPDAHVHFSLLKDSIAICPEPYLTAEAGASILALLRREYPNANMCY